jgi:hypothetical protein
MTRAISKISSKLEFISTFSGNLCAKRKLATDVQMQATEILLSGKEVMGSRYSL